MARIVVGSSSENYSLTSVLTNMTKQEKEQIKQAAYNKGYFAGRAKQERKNPFHSGEITFIPWNQGYNDGVKDAKRKSKV